MDRINSVAQLKAIQAKPDSNQIIIRVGMGTCGIAAGAKEALDVMVEEAKRLKINNITFVKTGCIGMCFAEPTVEVAIPGQKAVLYGNVDQDKAREIINRHLTKGELLDDILEIKNQYRIALRNCGVIDPENINDYIARDGYQALGKVIQELTPEQVIETVKLSGLRGRGGGGFPTGIKWQSTHNSPSDIKYIICNADEGDPGAFMDRSVLEGDPHSVLEAMAIAGYAIGAHTGYIYIRAEYPLAIARLEVALSQARECGLLGNNILGSSFSFDISLRYGAGAFVCGEETSLINSIQGSRGEPTNKPPYPAEKGLWGKPTSVNNVETFANIPPIFLRGPEWFASIGTEKSKGTKVFALAGSVNRVGLIEVVMGTTLRQIIYDIGGGTKDNKKFKAVQTGGPSGGCITEAHLDMPIDYEHLIKIGTMMGSGGMIVMNDDDCMVNFAKFYLEFMCEESCGKCTPCRIGNKRLLEILTKVTDGQGTEKDLETLKELGHYIKDTALCGLGQTAPNPVLSTLEYFEDEYLAHVRDKKCPSHVCVNLLEYHIVEDKCIGCTACARACPSQCITGEVKGTHMIDQSKCLKCGTCFATCKFKAIVRR
ncbi:NADH-quinone oxidoreductase subunit NuoF [Desulfitobacterium sp.]|uniref:NADH-quinone oxidoreductase subunit NuoF n=1 Tax=Desulfitobacterium sp. TaxID=49981 RepID=UPI002B1F398B|nr:NADH-quinone oxidoreductase subunit NuoF [Desulfitobacterium sp.]MEA4901324.1 NADH-quinone oxidoreductase subunit NuoF [Desulfitobacterium sp.]